MSNRIKIDNKTPIILTIQPRLDNPTNTMLTKTMMSLKRTLNYHREFRISAPPKAISQAKKSLDSAKITTGSA